LLVQIERAEGRAQSSAAKCWELQKALEMYQTVDNTNSNAGYEAGVIGREIASNPFDPHRKQILELQREVRNSESNVAKLKAQVLETQTRCQTLQHLVLQSGVESQVQHIAEDLMCAINDLNNERVARSVAREEAENMRRECRLMEQGAMAVQAELTRFMADSAAHLETIKISFPRSRDAVHKGTRRLCSRIVRFEMEETERYSVPTEEDDDEIFSHEVLCMISDLRKLHGSVYAVLMDQQGEYEESQIRMQEAQEWQMEAVREATVAVNRRTALEAEISALRKQVFWEQEEKGVFEAELYDKESSERQLKCDVFELGVLLEKEMSRRHAESVEVERLTSHVEMLLTKSTEELSDAAGRSLMDKTEKNQQLRQSVSERDAARASLSRLSIDSSARMAEQKAAIQVLEAQLKTASANTQKANELFKHECAVRKDLEARLQQSGPGLRQALEELEAMGESVKSSADMQSYLAAELKKEKESVLKLLGERHLLQAELHVKERERAHVYTTVSDISAENILHVKKINQLELLLIHARNIKIQALHSRISQLRHSISPEGVKSAASRADSESPPTPPTHTLTHTNLSCNGTDRRADSESPHTRHTHTHTHQPLPGWCKDAGRYWEPRP